MMLWTQEISRERDGTATVRSICTDKSMKKSLVHRWHRSGCTDEQVNCPFCLFVRKMPESNFPPDAYVSFSLWRGEKKKQQQQHHFRFSDWRNSLTPTPLKKEHKIETPSYKWGCIFSRGRLREIPSPQPCPRPRNHHGRAV